MHLAFPHPKTRFLLLLSFCLSTLFGYAQMGVVKTRIDEVGQIKEKPLLVVLEDETDPYYEAHFNENFRKAIELVWTFSPSVEFISHEAYLQMREKKDETTNYAILAYYNNEVMGDAPGHSFAIRLLDKKVSAHFVKMYKSGETWSYGDIVFALEILQKRLGQCYQSGFKNI